MRGTPNESNRTSEASRRAQTLIITPHSAFRGNNLQFFCTVEPSGRGRQRVESGALASRTDQSTKTRGAASLAGNDAPVCERAELSLSARRAGLRPVGRRHGSSRIGSTFVSLGLAGGNPAARRGGSRVGRVSRRVGSTTHNHSHGQNNSSKPDEVPHLSHRSSCRPGSTDTGSCR